MIRGGSHELMRVFRSQFQLNRVPLWTAAACCRFPSNSPLLDKPLETDHKSRPHSRQQAAAVQRTQSLSPSSSAISLYLKLVIVLSHAGVTDSLNFFALHHFQSEPTFTKP